MFGETFVRADEGEIADLVEEQDTARRDATFLGMTKWQGEKYDKRGCTNS
jgi:hypothetical protein